ARAWRRSHAAAAGWTTYPWTAAHPQTAAGGPAAGVRWGRAACSSWSSRSEGVAPDYSGAGVNAIFARLGPFRPRAALRAARPARWTGRGGRTPQQAVP